MTPRRSSAPFRLAGVAAILVGLIAASGCAAEPAPTSSPSAEAFTPPVLTDMAPLRGTIVPAGSLDHASIAAKIDNHVDARPQVGLERSDLVFEELVEGGLTRYVAVWQSDIPELLGPVRSIRPMDPDIISPFGGIVAYSGGQERFVDLMRQTPVYNAIHGQPDTESTFYRTPDKRAPHNVIVKAQELLAQHADLAAPSQQFSFAPDVPTSTAATEGTSTAAVIYRFSNQTAGSWNWNAQSGVFVRFQDGAPDLDSNGAQLQATNVIVIRVPVTNALGVPKTEMVGFGEAWVSTGGGTVHATWSKGSATAIIRLIDDNGVAVRLGAGNTWIELVPAEGSVEFVPPAAG